MQTQTERISKRTIKIVTLKGHVDYAIQYDDGSVAYEFPERVPAYLKRRIERQFKDNSQTVQKALQG